MYSVLSTLIPLDLDFILSDLLECEKHLKQKEKLPPSHRFPIFINALMKSSCATREDILRNLQHLCSFGFISINKNSVCIHHDALKALQKEWLVHKKDKNDSWLKKQRKKFAVTGDCPIEEMIAREAEVIDNYI